MVLGSVDVPPRAVSSIVPPAKLAADALALTVGADEDIAGPVKTPCSGACKLSRGACENAGI